MRPNNNENQKTGDTINIFGFNTINNNSENQIEDSNKWS